MNDSTRVPARLDVSASQSLPSGGKTRQVLSRDESALALLRQDDVSLVVVSREPLRTKWGDHPTFAPAHGAHLSQTLTVGAGVDLACGSFGPIPVELVRSDIALLVRALTSVAKCRRANVVLDVVDDDACRKFHVDYVGVRAVVTYAGPGTEWVLEGGAIRRHLAMPFATVALANRSTVPDRRFVRRARTFDLVVMKGLASKGNEDRGVVHRSPPILRRRLRRLVLTVTAPPQPGAS